MTRLRVHRPADPESRRASDSPLEIDAARLANGYTWAELFGEQRPVEVEIGCGKGLFLVTAAAAHPERSWFGIERSSEHLRRAIDRVLKAGLTNVRFAKVLAEDLLGVWAPAASVEGIHILYPDPWPKKRHHRRRLLGEEKGPATLAGAARVLVPGGRLSVATDHADYAAVIAAVVGRCPAFVREETFHSRALLPHPDDPITEFERKYRREGRACHCFTWRLAG